MTPRKLSESDKQDILNLYQQPGETTTTLAERYGVSNTTISRVLKGMLSEQDYEALVQQKRGVRPQGHTPDFTSELPLEAVTAEVDLPPDTSPLQVNAELSPEPSPKPEVTAGTRSIAKPIPNRRQRKRSSAVSEPTLANAELDTPNTEAQLQLLDVAFAAESEASNLTSAVDEQPSYPGEKREFAEVAAVSDLESSGATAFADLDADDLDDDDLDDDDLDDLDDDLDDEDDDLDDDVPFLGTQIQGKALVQVLPLSEASIPKTFYLVVDRMAELITRPLQDFGDLGQIPTDETQARTLPIFDNHRVARRFSKRNQRVIKVPDGRMLHKVGPYLHAKGITRLLIDGQVYAL